MRIFSLTILLSIACCSTGYAREDGAATQEKIGNFALPVAQQPLPLIGFGENIIAQGQTQFILNGIDRQGKKKYSRDFTPSLLYGITDAASVFLNVPFALRNKDTSHHSNGPEDLIIQFENALFTRGDPQSTDQATIVYNMSWPTGSSAKNPPTGYGAASFFLGGTYNHTTPNWMVFTSHGFLLPIKHKHDRSGDQFLYQCGLARNIPSPKNQIYAALLEFDGVYSWKDTVNHKKYRNSGGNVISLTPSIFLATESFYFQLGVSFPVAQHLFGHQRKSNFTIVFNIEYNFPNLHSIPKLVPGI